MTPPDLTHRMDATERRLDSLEQSVGSLRATGEATRAELGALSSEIRRASTLPAAGLANLLAGAATGSGPTAPAPIASSILVAFAYLLLPRLVAWLRSWHTQQP